MQHLIKNSLTPPIVSRETMDKFKTYYEEMTLWNKTLSLMETLPWDVFYHRHILDAIQLSDLIPTNEPLIDIGSGAGIPAIPLAILNKKVIMIESNKKKSIFLSQISKKLNLNTLIINDRVENCHFKNEKYLTARALAPLEKLLELASIVSRETIGIFQKGKKAIDEIEDAQKKWLFDVDIYRSITDKEGLILNIRNIKRKS